MAKLKYVGVHDEVDLSLPDGSHMRVKHGEAVEVPADVAKGLAESEAWETMKGVKDDG